MRDPKEEQPDSNVEAAHDLFSILFADPNVNIMWIENVDAKIKALRDIEEGHLFWLCVNTFNSSIYLVLQEHVIYRHLPIFS